MKLLFKYLGIQFKSQLQYKISFFLTFIAQVLTFFTFYFAIYALFNKFGNLKSFSFYEVLLCFSIVQIGFSFSEIFARGFDRFDRLIINGEFDRLIVRPQNIYLQVIGSIIAYERIGKLVQALVLFFIAISNLNIDIDIIKIITIVLMMIGTICVFFGIFILGASFCFVTLQGLEVINIFTDGGREMAQYPMGIYKKQFLYFFTFIIPFACVNYYPLLYVLGRSHNAIYTILPIIGIIFIIPCIMVFNRGIRSYRGTGS